MESKDLLREDSRGFVCLVSLRLVGAFAINASFLSVDSACRALRSHHNPNSRRLAV